jgi:hypothetical protein
MSHSLQGLVGFSLTGTTDPVTFLANRLAEKARLVMSLLIIFDLHGPGKPSQ